MLSPRGGEQAITVTEAFVTRLCEAGFTVEQALQAYFAVIQVVVGAVCLRSSLDARPTAEPGSSAEDSRTGKTDNRSLHAADSIPGELRSFLKRDQIAIGLPLIIDALRAKLEEAGT